MPERTWTAGDELPSYDVPSITPHELLEVMDVMRDTNPIHSDPELARALGFRGLVNQGPANLGYIVQMLLRAAPGAAVQDLRFRFHDNVVPGDELVATGTVQEVHGSPTGDVLTCSFALSDRPGGTSDGSGAAPTRVSGTAVLEVPRPGGARADA